MNGGLLFEIALPVKANDGADYAEALAAWEERALAVAGGFTRLPDADGAWRDPSDGKVYRDRMRGYRVMCNRREFTSLTYDAFRLFPDQVAIFTATIGSATVYDRASLYLDRKSAPALGSTPL